MGCSPTKEGKHDGQQGGDVYMQPDLDIEAYHFHHYVRDLVSIDLNQKKATGLVGDGVNTFLNTLYMEWPIPDPQKYKTLNRYGRQYETWPQTATELTDTIDRTEHRLINTILGDKLRPVAAYLKGAATMRELTRPDRCEAKDTEITWPDIQYIFRQMLLEVKDKDNAILLHPQDVPMLCTKVSLRYRVPKQMIKELMEGEWRIFHQQPGVGKGVAVDKRSYGMMIHNVTQVEPGPMSKGGTTPDIMKGGNDFTFTGGSRLDGDKSRYTVKDGHAHWNEKGNHNLRMTWTEVWKDGQEVNMEARLKVNGKFECQNITTSDGPLRPSEVKKGSRESNFSLDPHVRMQSKYYLGDRDAAFEDEIPFVDLIKAMPDLNVCQQMLRELFMAWPTVDSPDDCWGKHGDKSPVKVERKGHHIKTWPLAKAVFVDMASGCSSIGGALGKALAKEMIDNTEATEGCLVWPDVQQAFKNAGYGTGDIDRHHMCHKKVRLTLKIPENHHPGLVKQVLEGEWRMYCKGDGETNHKPAFSYGMYITDVELKEEKGHMKIFTYKGRSRVEGKWTLENGTAVWNEHHTGRVLLNYVEQWGAKGGTRDELKAHLKVNLKFECESTCGFIQKARRESTLPVDPEERMKNKYYIGDRDAAYEIDPTKICRFDDWMAEHGAAGVQEFLTHLFFQWPTLPKKPEEVKRYGHKRKTWPISSEEVVQCITAGDKYEQKVADGILLHMHEKGSCECQMGEAVLWPDFQVVFAEALGAAAKDVPMLKMNHKDNFEVALTLKIPEPLIEPCLCGEYRMYCKNEAQNNSFSYGLYIDTVAITETKPNAYGSTMKTLTFTGRPRQHGKYILENGTAVWNEHGAGRLFLKYEERWPDGMVDKLEARLKSNGKFACDSTAGFIQKARKENTLPPAKSKERQESKYYIGDQDAVDD